MGGSPGVIFNICTAFLCMVCGCVWWRRRNALLVNSDNLQKSKDVFRIKPGGDNEL